jgi:hypothetical protein
MACKMLRESWGSSDVFSRWKLEDLPFINPLKNMASRRNDILSDTAFPRGDDSWHFPSFFYSSTSSLSPSFPGSPQHFFQRRDQNSYQNFLDAFVQHLFIGPTILRPISWGRFFEGTPPAGSEARAWKGRGAPGTTGAQLVPHGGAPLRVSTFYDDAKRLRNI